MYTFSSGGCHVGKNMFTLFQNPKRSSGHYSFENPAKKLSLKVEKKYFLKRFSQNFFQSQKFIWKNKMQLQKLCQTFFLEFEIFSLKVLKKNIKWWNPLKKKDFCQFSSGLVECSLHKPIRSFSLKPLLFPLQCDVFDGSWCYRTWTLKTFWPTWSMVSPFSWSSFQM